MRGPRDAGTGYVKLYHSMGMSTGERSLKAYVAKVPVGQYFAQVFASATANATSLAPDWPVLSRSRRNTAERMHR